MLQINGISLYLEELGAGSPVLLLHGLGTSGKDYRLVAPPLSSHHRVIVPDLRGHGRSDKPEGRYSVPLLARDVAALCDRLGLTRVHVMGLSMGGMIAFQLAVDRPELVQSLVIINSGPDMVPRTVQRAIAFATRIVVIKLFGPKGMANMLAPKLFPKPEQEELRRQIKEQIGANDPSTYERATRGLFGWTVLSRLSAITCPVLVLSSERDYTPLSEKQAYVARLRSARLKELKDSGHAAPLDQPLAIVEEARAFFSEVEAGGAV